jgi:hypothetical protein
VFFYYNDTYPEFEKLPYLLLRLRMSGAVPALFLYDFMAWIGATVLFYLSLPV